jgi:hypothetical protein
MFIVALMNLQMELQRLEAAFGASLQVFQQFELQPQRSPMKIIIVQIK